MYMINRKDDCASFLILSCHKYPAYRSVAEGQIRASPGRENVPCCPPFLHLTSYRPVASTSQCNTSSGICFSAHLIKIGVLFSRVPRVRSAFGSREAQTRPLHSALADYELAYHCETHA